MPPLIRLAGLVATLGGSLRIASALLFGLIGVSARVAGRLG